MSKKMFCFCLLGMLFSLKEGAAREVFVALESFNHHGKKMEESTLSISPGKVVVDRAILSPEEIITGARELNLVSTFIETVYVPANAPCGPGFFRYVAKKDAEVKKVEGCLESEQYRALKKSFNHLKKDYATN